MADRHAYVPYIGLFIFLSWSIDEYFQRYRRKDTWVICIAILITLVLGILAWRQVRFWQNTVSLYNQAIEVTSDNFTIHLWSGDNLVEQGKLEEAIDHFNLPPAF